MFDPNPVVTLQNESLTDMDNADYPAIRRAYKIVTLTQLNNGQDAEGRLREQPQRPAR